MITAEYRNYLKSPQWDQRRRTALAHAGYRCERCGANAPLQVHHLTYKRVFREHPGDLQALCFPCHRWAHMTWQRKLAILIFRAIKGLLISPFVDVTHKLIHSPKFRVNDDGR